MGIAVVKSSDVWNPGIISNFWEHDTDAMAIFAEEHQRNVKLTIPG